MSTQRRHLLATAASGCFALSSARAQGLPDNAKILAGFAPGGTVDVTARRIAEKLRDVVARSVVVENRTGAGGQIALSALKTSPTDGLAFLVTPMSMLGIYPHTCSKLPDDPVADLMGLEARPSTPAELAGLLKRDTERWAPLIRTIGFSADS